MNYTNINRLSSTIIFLLFSATVGFGNFLIAPGDTLKEREYYRIETIPIPDDIVLEVGGLSFTDDDRLGISTRRGEVWLLENPYLSNGEEPVYKRYAHGLHEALGLAWKDGGFYLSQRGELTRLEDKNGDNVADVYKTVYAWPLSGNYHDYSYGPVILPNGDMLVTLNLSWIGYGESLVKWRGWMLKITPDGEMEPIATGLRSPAGFGVNAEGAVFYTENQGDWVGSGRMTHLEVGDFAGNPAGLRWADDPKSPLELKKEWVPNKGIPMHEAARFVPELKTPAIWFPHTLMGISTSDIIIDTTGGQFGPFEGQMFVGDQGHSKIMRVFTEKINGVYQGACFPFREGFSSGVLRTKWGSDGSMFVGMTSRGWNSTGPNMFGLQKLVWTGKTPFEIKTMQVQDDGFLLEFTQPVNKTTAADLASYQMTSFTYHYHSRYGSEILDRQTCMVHEAQVSEDGLQVKLVVHGMRKGYIHQLVATGVKNSAGQALVHDAAYYTLNEVPGGGITTPTIAPMVTSSENAVVQPKRQNKMPETWADGPERQIQMGTQPGLQYDTKVLEVKAGAKVELVFNNNDDMTHNLVIVKKGDAIEKITELSENLGLDGPARNYVPDSELVLFHTGLLEPETSESLYFEAPTEPGEYRYLCTFPGHARVMRGTLIVK